MGVLCQHLPVSTHKTQLDDRPRCLRIDLVKGMIIYAVGIGLITVVIRRFGAYPEGVQFAILIMNAFVPLINTYTKPKRFGEELKNG